MAKTPDNRRKSKQSPAGRPARRPLEQQTVSNGTHRSPAEYVDLILTNGGRASGVSRPGKPDHAAVGGVAKPAYRFIDLFCGIGGFRLAFERAGARCVFSSDWDKFSRQTYAANFGEEPAGDITKVPVADIPAFDILCGGFPCQPFSLAGVSKKNSLGRKHGFENERQGNLDVTISQC